MSLGANRPLGDVACIVPGRGADEKKVVSWLETAASVPGVIFANAFLEPIWNAEHIESVQITTRHRYRASAIDRRSALP